MKKILVTLGLAFALISTVVAGTFSHGLTTPGAFYAATVEIPNAGSALQSVMNSANSGYMINNGPLGSYTVYAKQGLTLNQPIAAGTYNIYQYISPDANGSSVTLIFW